jgi:signal transduction histidine kinase
VSARSAPTFSVPGLEGFPLREALDHTGLGVLAADAYGRITLVSPALRELFRIPDGVEVEASLDEPGDMPGPIFADRSPMTMEQTPLACALRGEFVKNTVLGTYDAEGNLIWFQCNGIPLYDADGLPAGGIVLMQDVTAQQEAAELEEQLRQRLVHTVNHEFRTPLAALLGNLEVVRDHHDGVGEDLARSLAAIERSAWRLCHLVGTAATLIEKQEELHRAGRTPDGAPYRT